MNIKENLTREDLVYLLSLLISDKPELLVEKEDNHIKIELKETNSFNDTETKEIVNDFKTLLKELDDSVFLEVTEQAEKAIHMKRFDELLNKEKYSEAEATEVESFIDYFSQLIYSSLQSRIESVLF